MADSKAANRFNAGDAIQIGAGMGMVMMMAGTNLIASVITGISVCVAVLGAMVIARRIKNGRE